MKAFELDIEFVLALDAGDFDTLRKTREHRELAEVECDPMGREEVTKPPFASI